MNAASLRSSFAAVLTAAALACSIHNPVGAATPAAPAPAATTPGSPAPAASTVPVAQTTPVVAPTGPFTGTDGVLRFPYGGRTEPTLTCRPLYVCDVVLQPGESILNIGTGDTVRWVIAAAQSGPSGNTPHVFVKPTETSLETNMVVTTTKHVYYLRLLSGTAAPNPRIGFYYPEEDAQKEVDRQRDAQRLVADKSLDLPVVPPEQLDTNYRTAGERTLLPTRIYNDGLHTFLEYTTLPNDLPVLYAVAPDGSNQIVNFRLSNLTFVVDGTPSGIDLVLNAGTGKHGHGERRAFVRHK